MFSSNVLFEGKTIAMLDDSAVNCWTFTFTDGTKVEIEVERVVENLHGMVANKVD